MGLRLKNFDIMGVHWKIWFLGEALHENQYTGGGCFKRGLGLFADLRKGLEKKRGMVFLRGGRGLIPQCTLWVQYYRVALLLWYGGKSDATLSEVTPKEVTKPFPNSRSITKEVLQFWQFDLKSWNYQLCTEFWGYCEIATITGVTH